MVGSIQIRRIYLMTPAPMSAPIMIIGVIIGAMLCFSGNPLKRFWFPLRCFLFGAIVMLLGVQFLLESQATATLFAQGATFRAFLALLETNPVWWHTLLKVLAAIGGGVAFFFLGRAKNKPAVFITNILTAFTTACTAALLIATGGFGVVTLPMALVIAGVLTIVLIPICVARFDYYYAAETGLAGALLTSYMFARFYYFSDWLFWILALVLAFCGIYLQERAAIRHREKLSQPSASDVTLDILGEQPTEKGKKRFGKKDGKKAKIDPVVEIHDAPVESAFEAQQDTSYIPPADKE